MKKTRKQILGITGLATVGIMTAIACGMPAPDAAAATEYGSDTTIRVSISEEAPSNKFVTPSDGSSTTNGIIKVSTNYSQAKKLEFYLSYTDANGAAQRVEVASYEPSDDAGTYSFDLDVTRYGFGNYVLSTYLTGSDGVSRESDTVSFSYSAMVVAPDTGKNEEGDPTIGVEVGKDIEKVIVTIFDKNGNQVKDKNGEPITIEFGRSAIDPITGKILVDLPFGKYSLPAGDYTAIVTAYDKDDQIVSFESIHFSYAPVTPDTPNTGMLSIGDLNISRADYLITGLIAFGVAAGFAIALIYRRSRR